MCTHGLTCDRGNSPDRCANENFLDKRSIGHVGLASDGEKRYYGDGKDRKVGRLSVDQ
jgi:hypothetical protein